jgi:2-desacetyl-2-hydroxyethyl bacteriochlorophyllide A dehydrogenase
MEAIVFSAPGALGCTSIAAPEPGPGEVLVKTHASGICHTDIDILHGRYGTATFPLVPGHEYAGTVEALGPGTTGFAEGDRVVVDPNFHCGHCRACRKGLTNLCENLGAYGVTKNGGFAEFSTVAAANLVPIGAMPFDRAALAEPMGCVLNGLATIGTEGVKSAAVFGAGPIGLLMALALRARGAGVTLIDRAPSRLDFAQSFGFATLAAGSPELAETRHAFDLAADATGVPQVAEALIGHVANGGRALIFGVCPPEARISLAPYEIFRRQITLAGAHSLNHNIPESIALIERIGPEIDRLVSHRVPLAEIADFMAGTHEGRTLKVQAIA